MESRSGVLWALGKLAEQAFRQRGSDFMSPMLASLFTEKGLNSFTVTSAKRGLNGTDLSPQLNLTYLRQHAPASWQPCWQSPLKCRLLGCGPHFAPNKL